MNHHPLRLGGLLRAGARDLSEYTGMVLALFVVQVIVTFGAWVVVAQVMMTAFAGRPVFDDAVDGDLVSWLQVLQDYHAVFAAVGVIAAGAALAWVTISWFLTGGVIAVLTERPRGRRDTARCFGAGGAATFLVYLRLAVWSFLLDLLPTAMLLLLGIRHLADALEYALTVRELIVPMIVAFLPAALYHVAVSTAVDLARAELTLRRPTHERLGATRALFRAVGFVVRRPLAIGHVLLYWLVFLALSLAFVWMAQGRAMLGASGALALLALREGLALCRFALKIGVIAGQVELTATRPPPPRAVATTDEA
ncbi:MAG TPA: hypothetical protein VHE35_20725 [Kofleriaceae bacterium]|nr:hypothetical protein [Kofleriaceae bacterium]